jgi:hypothetical protein
MSEMVERVARELAVAADHANWEEFVPDARMAIRAMREPTEKMLKEGNRSTTDGRGAEESWPTMIDEALK